MNKPLLTDEDFERAAATLNCDVAAIQAVSEVESSGAGFLLDGQPRILFEAHQFHARTGGVYSASHPNISSRTWNRALYATGPTAEDRGQKEHLRLQEAAALNREAALMSASWGKFQILGANHALAGHLELQDFINAMYESEGKHLDAFVNFVISKKIDGYLRLHQWDRFASSYNGASYAVNNYHLKLAVAWNKYHSEHHA